MSKFNDLRKRGISLLTAAFTIVSLSGCTNTEDIELEKEPVATAIIMENENALILDVGSYQYFDGYANIYDKYDNMMKIDNDNVIVVEGENSQERAKLLAETLISENGKVSILSGYVNNNTKQQNDLDRTAIVMTNEKVLILDVSSYQYFDEYSRINDMYGNMMRIGNDNVILIEGEYSKQMATFVVECLFGENAEISFYDDLSINGKSR